MAYPSKFYHPLYLDVIYTTTVQFTANKAIKLFFGELSENLGFRTAEKALIPLSICTCMLLCLITPFYVALATSAPPPTPQRAKLQWKAFPTVYKCIQKAYFLKSATFERAISTTAGCVFARPPELILSNFSASLVPVIKEV